MADQAAIPADLKERMKNSYDAMAVTYNEKFGGDEEGFRIDYTNRLLDLLKNSQSPTSTPLKVLELGCGAGTHSTRALLEHKDLQFKVIGNDLSPAQLDLARQGLKEHVDSAKLELLAGDMMTLDFPAETFDAVTGFYSIIHLPREEQTVLMGKIAQWLKPGGYLLGNFAEEESKANVSEKWLGEEEGWTFWSAWGKEGSLKMVKEAGLEVVVEEVRKSEVDAAFLWVIARKA